MQHVDDGYSRRGNFGGSSARNTVIIYSPDGSSVCESRSEEFDGIGSV